MSITGWLFYNEIIWLLEIVEKPAGGLSMRLKTDDKYLLVKKYLESHSLVESNIISFNNFIEKRMQEIVDDLSESLPKEEDIEIIGDIDSLKRQFTLKRSFWNYPALVAFQSSRLTHLVYFSRWAKLIHDVMYTFRKRPI